MTLISLLIVLLLEHFFKVSALLEKELKSHNWFPNWYNLLNAKIQQPWFNGWTGLVIILGLPALIVYGLTDLNNGFLFWIFQLILTVAVMIYCLGPIDQNPHLSKYFEAVDREDIQAACNHIEHYLDLKESHDHPEDIKALGRSVTKLILVQSNFRYFAILLYFVLLGPAGALFYRLMARFEFTSRDDETSQYTEKLQQLRNLLDWLPARLTGLLYTLAGNFTAAMSSLKRHIVNASTKNNKLIEETGLAAIGCGSNECDNIIEENQLALDLVSRSVFLMLVIIAVLTVFGWIS